MHFLRVMGRVAVDYHYRCCQLATAVPTVTHPRGVHSSVRMLSVYTAMCKCLLSLWKEECKGFSGPSFCRRAAPPLIFHLVVAPSQPGCENQVVRNPDKWHPPDPDESANSNSRRAALIGLLVILLLLGAGLLLSRILSKESRFEDCSISGRADCAEPKAP